MPALLKLPAFAANVSLAWNANADPSIAGYNLYCWIAGGTSTNKTSAGNATHLTLSNLVIGATCFFAATTCNTNGLESAFSSVVSYKVPLTAGAANQPPTLNAINNLVINKNAGMQTVSLSGITTGATDNNQTLTVKAVSSDTSLIPQPTVNYISPHTTGSLTFTPVFNRTGTATITVTVKDSGTSNNIVARNFTLTIADSTGTTTRRQPVITGSLTNQVALIGQTRSFTVKATGRGSLKYQWKFNGTNLSTVGPTLTLSNVSTNQSGVYSVTVTDWDGSTNSTASLTVYATAAGTLASAGLANGHYTMAVQSVPGCRYIVQATTDVVNWVPVQTNTAPFSFEDAAAGRFSQRFYRAVYAP